MVVASADRQSGISVVNRKTRVVVSHRNARQNVLPGAERLRYRFVLMSG
jgi:hypothetical protein